MKCFAEYVQWIALHNHLHSIKQKLIFASDVIFTEIDVMPIVFDCKLKTIKNIMM